MGIDLHNLGLLAHAQDLGASFGRTIGIGRQAVFIDAPDLERHRRLRGLPELAEPARAATVPRYFEPMLTQWFGAGQVDSVDASPYEAATVVHDMNLPWRGAEAGLGSDDAARLGAYDAVLDFGCLEHVFDFPTAWRNCVDLCSVGGHLLHSLPANNLTGHGFYQFSPELFFNLYRPENGFELRGLWLAQKPDLLNWWRVADPRQLKRRVTLRNGHETYMLVIAKKLHETGTLAAPQQSDYAEQEWLGQAAAKAPTPFDGNDTTSGRGGMAAALASLGLIDAARAVKARVQALRASATALPGPDYERVVVAELLRRRGPAGA